jgi:arylsulfatase A-like enzyme
MSFRLTAIFILIAWFMTTGCGDDAPAPISSPAAAGRQQAAPADRSAPGSQLGSSKSTPKVPPVEAPGAYFAKVASRRLDGTPAIQPTEGTRSAVLIVMDALNARHLGLYGYHRDTSPAIDGIADGGIFFTNHVSNSSWTRPSYTTIITGLPKSGHGVELGTGQLEDRIATLAERFQAAGYHTAGIVGNPLVREIWGFGQGYQVYKDTASFDKAFPWDGQLIDEAIGWLKRQGDHPFFLTLFLTSAHVPYRPPRLARRFLKAVQKGPVLEYPFREYPSPLKKADHDRIVAAYDDEIAYMDREIGRLVSYLKSSGQYDKTVLLLTADHGEVFGNHNCYTHTYHMWEQALRVPLVLHAPGLQVRGVYDDRPYTHVDIAPTLLDLAGQSDHKKGLSGRSIAKALADRTSGRERVRLSQYNAHGIRRQAIRDGRYKLVHYHKIDEGAFRRLNSLHSAIPTADPEELPSLVASLKGERYEAYDLFRDPEEKTDRFAELKGRPEIQGLLEELRIHLKEKDDIRKLSKETVEALKNAGYFISDGDAEKLEESSE